MKLEFLQASGDTDAFADFLYDQGYVVSRRVSLNDGIPMERQFAKEALVIDLISGFGTYYIGCPDIPKLLPFDSCGSESHPRCTERMSRYTGAVILGEQYATNEHSLRLFKCIKKYFREKYLLARIREDQKFKCYWGPDYQLVDAKFIANPEPSSLCPGYICIKCAPQHLEQACRQLRWVVEVHPQLQNSRIYRNLCATEKDTSEAYLSFLFDRTLLGTEDMITIAKTMNPKGCQMCVVRQKRYESVSFAKQSEKLEGTLWNVRIHVEQEWKGFGVFCQPGTWFI